MNTRALWATAAAVAALGTWLMFDTAPGVNWAVWVTAAALGLLWMVARRRSIPRSVLFSGLAASVIAGSAAITANPVINVLSVGAVILYLALQMLLSARPEWRSLTLLFAVTAPAIAFFTALVESARQSIALTSGMRSPVAGARVRGVVLTVPVLVVFALLLSNADPVFALWRGSIESYLNSWAFLPRLIFFFGLLAIVLGAYSFAGRERSIPERHIPEFRVFGSTERTILLAGVAGLFWLFLGIQLSYLFGTSPAEVGSGITFAEYARRGFVELTVVATAAAALIILGEVFGRVDREPTRLLRYLTFGVLVAVFLLVASAFNRVLLYEEAYGYTTARLYGKTYMVAVGVGLVALSLEVMDRLDGGRLFRRSLAVATVLFVGLAFWNHEAWIANRNIDRFEASGRLDVEYLARGLSLDAVPAIAARLPDLPPDTQAALRREMQASHGGRSWLFSRNWYEWNLSRERAREALAADFGITSSLTRASAREIRMQ